MMVNTQLSMFLIASKLNSSKYSQLTRPLSIWMVRRRERESDSRRLKSLLRRPASTSFGDRLSDHKLVEIVSTLDVVQHA